MRQQPTADGIPAPNDSLSYPDPDCASSTYCYGYTDSHSSPFCHANLRATGHGLMAAEYLQRSETEQGEAFTGMMLVGAELCQSSESPVPIEEREEALQHFKDEMLKYDERAKREDKHVSEYRYPLFREAVRMAVQCGLKVDLSDIQESAPNQLPTVSPQPTLIVAEPTRAPATAGPNPTKQMEQTIAAAQYIVDNDWRIPFPDARIYCAGADLMNRSYALRRDIDGLENKIATTNYTGTPGWHRDIQQLAKDLGMLIAEFEDSC